MILLVCILTNEDAYLYKVWLKYLQPDERYGPDTISVYKINKECNSVKIGTRDIVLVFRSSFDVAQSLYQVLWKYLHHFRVMKRKQCLH